MTKFYISLEKTDLYEWCDISLLTYFLLFPSNFQRAMTNVIVTRCLRVLETSNETSLESPKPVILNENDTDKIYHEDIFMVF